MPEYTYDPVAGTSVETRGGRAVNVEGESAFVAEKGFGTIEDYQDHQLEQTAKGLSRRSLERTAVYRTTDEDIDQGTYNPELVAIEEKLQNVQQQLMRSNNPLEQARLATEAESLASQLVNGRLAEGSDPTIDPNEGDGNSFEDQVRAEMGDLASQILQNAADNLPEESSAHLNELLSDSDELVKKTTFRTLEQFQKHPEAFVTDRSQYANFNDSTVSRINEIAGPTVGDQICILNAALVAGHTTPAQVMKLAAKSPHLLRGLMDCAKAGVIKIAL